MKEAFSVIGQPLPKVDAWAKVTGETRYADDLVLPRMAYGKLLRSAHAHARILAIDTTRNPNAPRVQGTFNTVIVATMHNTVYAYDADNAKPGPDGRTVPLWATWLGQPRGSNNDIDMFATNDPEWGILSTPVISDDRKTLYVVAWHDDGAQAGRQGAQRHSDHHGRRHLRGARHAERR